MKATIFIILLIERIYWLWRGAPGFQIWSPKMRTKFWSNILASHRELSKISFLAQLVVVLSVTSCDVIGIISDFDLVVFSFFKPKRFNILVVLFLLNFLSIFITNYFVFWLFIIHVVCNWCSCYKTLIIQFYALFLVSR